MSAMTQRCANCFRESPGEPCRHCGWQPGTPTPAPYLPVGTRLDGRYRLGRVLGHGGFGITYLGWDDNLDLKLAIKEYLPRDFATRPGDGPNVTVYSGEARQWFAQGLQRFQDEARTLAKFQQHPGIVSVYNFFLANGTGYMVMEYIEGVTLRAYLEKKGPMPYETTRKALLPVMDALREVHAAGLLHRDVSPDNIYITFQKQVKLLDFGAARFAAGEHSRSLSVILKPGYAPEEQYRTHGRQGPWTDVYGLAATFYRCLTGEIPPEALDRLEQDNLKRPSALGIAIPSEVERMLLAGLAVRASERPQSMEVFQQVFLQPIPSGAGDPAPRLPAGQTAPVSTFTAVGPPPAEQLVAGSQSSLERSSVRPVRKQPAKGAGPIVKSGSSGTLGWVAAGVVFLLLGVFQGGKEPTKTSVSAVQPPSVAVGGSGPAYVQPPTEPIDPKSQYNLGMKYFNGDGVPQNYTEAVKWYRKAAEQGFAQAQFNLGVMYESGRGVPQSDIEAVRWYRLAAEQGYAAAQFNLGVMYESGRGVPQSDIEAVRWYRLAAEQGYAAAQSNLGVMYAEGRGVPQNVTEAVRWYRKAAEQGVAVAQSNLGNMYYQGKGVPQSDTEAVKWFRKAAEQGYAAAQSNLGVMYAEGRGVPQNDTEAVRWYRQAAEQGYAAAQLNLGGMYESGRGVPQSDIEAVRWYRLAAEQGEATAQFNLGLMYAKGRGVPQNDTEAVRWYRQAAEQGEAKAQYNLGVMYALGRGVPQSDTEAVRWYRQAAEQGEAKAQYNLGVMYANGRGVPQNDTEAVRWFRQAAEQGDARAQFGLGIMYADGRGVPQNDTKAVRWYRQASQGNDAEVRRMALDALRRLEGR